MLEADGDRVQKTEELNLFSTHEEADSRMFNHLKWLTGSKNVVLRTNDTDVLVIALGNMAKIDNSLHVWLEVGLSSSNTLRYISVNEIWRTLGSELCGALPGFHAFTGCDYTASFSRKGKIRPLKYTDTPNVASI